eukprot:6986905-Prymnesium_polylepis.1
MEVGRITRGEHAQEGDVLKEDDMRRAAERLRAERERHGPTKGRVKGQPRGDGRGGWAPIRGGGARL